MDLSSFSNVENVVQLLTDYMHGHKIEVTEEVMLELLSLADMLQIDDITNYCRHRIQIQSLNKENCLQILKACSLYDIEHPKMDTFIRENLIELSQRKYMLGIIPGALKILLTDKNLSYWSMDDRFIFITEWCSARDDRTLNFETWFKYLDFYKLDRNIIEIIVKKEKLVRGSKPCLDMVNLHLCERQDKPVPFVFILNNIRTGSNVLGFNMEDKQLYKFNFPNQMIHSKHITVAESGHILSIKQTTEKVYVYDYDINTNVCDVKTLQSEERLPDALPQILDANGRLILIFDKVRDFYPLKGKGTKRGSILYQQISDDGKEIRIEPLLTFSFDISCACFSESMIIVSSTASAEGSKLVCFHLETNTIIIETVIIIPRVRCILPLLGKLVLVSYPNYCLLLELDKESNSYIIKDETPRRDMWGGERASEYILCSDFIVEINSHNIRLCDTRTGEIDMKNWKSYDLEHQKFDCLKSVYGYLNRTKPLCALMCPHCDPDAMEKQDRRKISKQPVPYFDDDNDDQDSFDDDDDDQHWFEDDDDKQGYFDFYDHED